MTKAFLHHASSFLTKQVIVAFVALTGVALACIVGFSQFNSEKKDDLMKDYYEVQTVSSILNQKLLRAREITRLFQSSFMLSAESLVSHDVTEQEKEMRQEAELARAYNQIDPKMLLDSFEAVSYSHYTENKGFLLSSSYPLTKNILLARWTPTLVDQKAFDEAIATNFITLSVSENDPSLLLFHLPLIERGRAYGVITASFSKDQIFKQALGAVSEDEGGLAFVVVDITSSPQLIYHSLPSPPSDLEMLRRNTDDDLVSVIPIGNRLWKIYFYPTPPSIFVYLWPAITVLLILAATLLGCLLIYRVLINKDNAEVRALQMLKKFISADTKFRHVTENMPGLVLVLTKTGIIVEVNKNGRDLLNLPKDRSLTKDNINVLDLLDDPDLAHSLATLEIGQSVSLSMMYQKSTPKTPPSHFNVSLSKVIMDDGIQEGVFVIMIGHDVTHMLDLSQQLQAQTQQLHFLATHDQLTGLFNRRAFEEKIEHMLQSEKTFSLLYVDLDQFKIVNDTAGHLAGDGLLQQLSSVIQDNIRHCFARLGGDEFGLLVEGEIQEGISLAEKIIKLCEQFVFTWEGKVYQVSCSIGIADMATIKASLSRPLNKEDLMSRADSACYTAKKRGRNRYHAFSNEGDSLTHQQEMEWTVKITEAMTNNRIALYRQDIVPLDHDAHAKPHFEILSRMIDENGNVIPASEFVPAIERFGLHLMFDKWVLTQTLKNFHRLHPDGFEICSVNVSGQTIDDPEFETFLFNLIEETKIDPSHLCLEITETATISNIDKMKVLLPKIKKTGCKIALDDFGVGMSSFAYLKNFDVDYVKIDGSFVRDIENNVMSSSIVTAVTDIAHKMGIKVVAEWVSSDKVLSMLKKKGVDFGQGYYLGKPQPIDLL